MKALISPIDNAQYISEYSDIGNDLYQPIFSNIPNGQRVVDVSENEFDVAEPLFWVDCDNSTTPMTHYYDSSDLTVKLISDLQPEDPSIIPVI